MFGKILFALSLVALVRAQIPSLGFCPEYVPMANFDMDRFLGVWYEAERYFQLTEVVSRCVTANYTKSPDGKYRVSNEVTNRFTGIKRILEGEIKKPASKADEGKLLVKYTVPLTPETKYSVLETDYDSYAVLWSCSGLGPVHTQNAWLMTRERLAPGKILQKAYGVLDKYKISKSFFVKTDQDDCAYLDASPAKPAADVPAETPEATPEAQNASPETSEDAAGSYRFAVVPDAPNVIVQTRRGEVAAAEKLDLSTEDEKVKGEPERQVYSVPEKILKAAEMEELSSEEMAEEDKPRPLQQEQMVESVEKAKDTKA